MVLHWAGWGLALVMLLHTHEAAGSGEVTELGMDLLAETSVKPAQQAENWDDQQNHLKKKVAQATDTALKEGSQWAVQKIFVAKHNLKLAKEVHSKAVAQAEETDGSESERLLRQAQNKPKKRKKSKEEKYQVKLHKLVAKFQIADAPETAQKYQRKMAKLRRKLRNIDRLRQLARAKLAAIKLKATNMHRDFKSVHKPMMSELQSLNEDMQAKITKLNAGKAEKDEKVTRAKILGEQKAALELKVKQDEQNKAEKERATKAYEAQLSKTTAEEALMAGEQTSATSKMASAEATLKQDTQDANNAKLVSETTRRHMRELQRQIEEAIIANQTHHVLAMQDAMAESRKHLQSANVVTNSAVAAAETAKEAVKSAERLALVNDDMDAQKYEIALEHAKKAITLQRHNETLAEQEVRAAKNNVSAQLTKFQMLSAQADRNTTAIAEAQASFRIDQSSLRAKKNRLFTEQVKVNNTVNSELEDKQMIAEQAATKNMNQQVSVEKLDSHRLQTEIRDTKEEEAIAEDSEKKDRAALKTEAAAIDKETKREEEKGPTLKLVGQDNALEAAEQKRTEQTKAKITQVKYTADMELAKLRNMEVQVKALTTQARLNAEESVKIDKSKRGIAPLMKQESTIQAQELVATIPEEKILFRTQAKGISDKIAKLTQEQDAAQDKNLKENSRLQFFWGESHDNLRSVEVARQSLELQAGASLSLAQYAQARSEVAQIATSADHVKHELTQAQIFMNNPPALEDNSQGLVTKALAATSDNPDNASESTDQLLANTQKDLISVEATADVPAVAPKDDYGTAQIELAAQKVQRLVDAKASEREKALQTSELGQEEQASKNIVNEAAAKASLDDLTSQLEISTHAVASANQNAESLQAKLLHADEAEKKQIGKALKVQRERAAQFHVQVQGFISKVAGAKAAVRTTDLSAATNAMKEQLQVKLAQSEAKSADIVAKKVSIKASDGAKADVQVAQSQESKALADKSESRQQAELIEKEIKDLRNKATSGKVNDPEQESLLQTQVSEKQEQLANVLAKEDKAAAQVAGAEQSKATADNKAIQTLVSSTQEAKLEQNAAAQDASVKEQLAADATVRVEDKQAEVKAAKLALETANTPAKAAEVSKKLANAEQAASKLESTSTAASQAAKGAETTAQAAEATVAADEAKVATVQKPYENKAQAAQKATAQAEYQSRLSDAIAKSGLSFVGRAKWVAQEAQQLTSNDSTAAQTKSAQDAETSRAVSAATGKLQKKIVEIRNANTIFQKRIEQKAVVAKAEQEQAKQTVTVAFNKLSKSAAENTAPEPPSTSSKLQAVVNEAVKEGGKSGSLESMLGSLESESTELGDSMSQSESKERDQQVLNEVYDELGAPTALLQMSRWTWHGPIPADGVPNAPKIPLSSSSDELYKKAVDKTERIVKDMVGLPSTKVHPFTTEAPRVATSAEDAEANAKASIAEAKQRIKDDTKALNEAKDQTHVALLTKRIESSKKLVENAEKKEQQADTQKVQNKIQHTSKTQASGTDANKNLVVDAMDKAVEMKDSVKRTLVKDENKIESLQDSLGEVTSTKQVDRLNDKINVEKADARQDEIKLKQAANNVAIAGVSEILKSVRSGSMSGATAIGKAKELEESKLREELAEKNKRVASEQTKIQNIKDRIQEAQHAISNVKAASKQANSPDAGSVEMAEVTKLETRTKQEKQQLTTAKTDEKMLLTDAGVEIQNVETKEKQLDKASHQAQRSVQRNERKEMKKISKDANTVTQDAVKVEAEKAATNALKQENEAALKQASNAPSALLQATSTKNAKEASQNEQATAKILKKEEVKLSNKQHDSLDAKAKLIKKIEQAVHKVVTISLSKNTRLDRRKAREVASVGKQVVKKVDKEDKLRQEVVSEQAKVTRADMRVKDSEAAITELKAKKERLKADTKAHSLTNSIGDGNDQAQLTQAEESMADRNKMQEVTKQLDKTTNQLEMEKVKVQSSQKAFDAASGLVEKAQRDQQQAKREEGRAKFSQIAAKTKENVEKSISENEDGAIKQLELSVKTKSESKIYKEEEQAQ